MLDLELDTSPHDEEARKRNMRFTRGLLGCFPKIHAYMKVRTDLTFKKLRHGGQYRGVTWDWFKTPYIYRNGKRVKATRSWSIVQDTMNLRRKAAETVFVSMPNRLSIGNRVIYGPYQQAMRPYLFFEEPKDAKVIGKIVAEYMLTGEK